MHSTARKLPAVVLVVAALLVAMAGSASAAKLITGKQIKNGTVATIDVADNSLRGADIKNGSVGAADLKNGSVTGTDVKDGSIGVPDLDPAALTSVSAEVLDSGVDVGGCGGANPTNCVQMMTRDLQPGTHLVTAAFSVANVANAAASLNNRCALVDNNAANLHEARHHLAATGDPGDIVSVSLSAVVEVETFTQVSLRCTEQLGEDLVLVDARLTALQVSAS